jgi:endogenous inhibitor of DNA gyrase (YacG/DUF329 family)
MARKLNLKCPICKKLVTSKDVESPFCSDRCREIDLGNWASERYRMAGEPVVDHTGADTPQRARLESHRREGSGRGRTPWPGRSQGIRAGEPAGSRAAEMCRVRPLRAAAAACAIHSTGSRYIDSIHRIAGLRPGCRLCP